MPRSIGDIPVFINHDQQALIGHAELFGEPRSRVAQIVITCPVGSADELEAMLVDKIPMALSFVYKPIERVIPKYLVRQTREVLVDAESPALARDLGYALLTNDDSQVKIKALEVFRED